MKEMTMIEEQSGITTMLSFLSDCARHNGGTNDWYYKGGSADLLLQHGKWYEPAPLPQGIRRGQMKQCFYNAAMAAIDHGLRYVEGYALSIIPVHHAWCVDDAGKVVEVTWKNVGLAYFGVEFPWKRVINYKRAMAESVLI
jgi:hypothetical protein